MFNRKKKIIICIIFFISRLYTQISVGNDTVIYNDSLNSILLKNQFIIESSLIIRGEINLITADKIDYINGVITLPDSIKSQNIIINYNYLTNGLPISYGPKWKLLPILDNNISDIDSIFEIKPSSVNKKESSVFTSGSLNRKITFSNLQNPDFAGGMQLQINGRLSEELSINGVLTDQDFSIHPDGTTQNLDELDNVYLSVLHKDFSIKGGNIIYKNRNINRKLIGIDANYKNKDIYSSSVYASSKGNFKYLELKGRDGNQGPYQLTGKEGNPDIIVLSGTEKIWVDGNKLIRGNNFDYTIDYYNAEIIFTPKILINFDSDILIEYQYSDYEYQQTFLGGNYRNKIDKHFIDIGLYSENDIYNEEELFEEFSSANNEFINRSTVIDDENGDYIFKNNIYIFDPSHVLDDTDRYQIVFQFDIEGEYARNISDLGEIYYEYVFIENRENYDALYSPYAKLNLPKRRQFGYFDYSYHLNKNFNIYGKFSGSIIDNYQINDDISKIGSFITYGSHIDSLQFGPGSISLYLTQKKKDDKYSSIGRENNILYNRLWNLDSTITNGIEEKTLQSEYTVDNFGKSYIQISQLKYLNNKFSKFSLGHESFNNLFDESYYRYLIVNGKQKDYKRLEFRLQTNQKKWIPYISFLSEIDNENEFWKTGLGFNIKKDKNKISTGIDYRRDRYTQSEENIYTSNDVIGSIQYDLVTNTGVKQNITYKKRIKSSDNIANNHDYSLFDLNVKNYKPLNNFNWKIQLRKEERLHQQIAVVYDSIGFGKGDYRYDSTFNTYIPDSNGDYIAYNIFSGNKIQNTSIIGGQSFSIRFSEIPLINNTIIRLNSKQDFQGKSPTINRVFYSKTNDQGIMRGNIFNRVEIYFKNKSDMLFWFEQRKELNGMDPRGNEQKLSNEIGSDITKIITENFLLCNKLDINKYFINSIVSNYRNRNWSGWWNDFQLQYRFGNYIDIDLGFLLGSDKGQSQNNNFSGKAYGLKLLNKILYKDTGRFQSEISLVNVTKNNENVYLPPESLNGYPSGMSFRSNWRMQYYPNKSISLIISINTINDKRYNDFIAIQGEVRAHF